MSTKEYVRRIIAKMPETCTLNDVIHQLYLNQRITQGLEELDAGRGIAHAAVKKEVKRWHAKK